jgi:hypothetical protein
MYRMSSGQPVVETSCPTRHAADGLSRVVFQMPCHFTPAADGWAVRRIRIVRFAHLELQACLWLIWSSDPGCVSYRTCGYRTREPPLYLSERRQGALNCNGFRVSSPMLQCGLRTRRGALGLVLGTSQYIVRLSRFLA